jgi:pimeloyl-ACP methyl ester carboxylesterase
MSLKRKIAVISAIAVVIIIVVILTTDGGRPAFTPPITDANGDVIPGSIATIETVVLGGIEQTVTIRGANTTKPVLLFLHGGPGMPSSPWATWNNVHADLEANFVFVHWDQRGAGKSYSEDLTADEMHLDNFVSDILELTDILRDRFDQDKIFLWGHSWGCECSKA